MSRAKSLERHFRWSSSLSSALRKKMHLVMSLLRESEKSREVDLIEKMNPELRKPYLSF